MEYTNVQYKFICELIWGVVPIDKNWALESDMFKNNASKILKKYPHLDKSFIEVSKQEVVISKVIKKADFHWFGPTQWNAIPIMSGIPYALSQEISDKLGVDMFKFNVTIIQDVYDRERLIYEYKIKK
jgi:hypothetical protein